MGPETTFFSYARSDSDFVLKLARDLRKAGADVWLDQLDIEAGNRWDLSVGEALKDSKKMLVILSPDSVSSNNVMDEVSFALEAGKTVIPILFKACDIPFRLRRVQHADFTINYDEALKNLLQALKLSKITSGLHEKNDSERTSEEVKKSEKAEEEKLKAQAEARIQDEVRILKEKAETERQEEERKLKEQAEVVKRYNESISITHANILKRKKYKIPLIIGGIIAFLVIIISVAIKVSNVVQPITSDDAYPALAIGDIYQGGIIFYIDSTYQHGLIAAQSDQSNGIQWSTDGLYLIGGTYVDIGAGPYNTNILYNSQETGNNAAELCTDLILNGYDDWALPSILELEQLYNYQNIIGGFSGDGYWSSTEYNSDMAWYKLFSDGTVDADNKELNARVRAIRAF
jgi:hypothetical protein